jgi:5'-3' exoribonuclease 1
MVIMSDNAKINLGLSLKFEAKALKVIDYSRKDGKHWEFSEKAVELIREYRVRTSSLVWLVMPALIGLS